MNEAEWKGFLTDYNHDLLSYEEVVETLPRKLLKDGWLGYPGAPEAEIAAAEKRLGTRLPPSYRAFLAVSNGWRYASISIFDLLPVAKLAWFREKSQDWIDAYVGPSAELPRLSDKEYFVYGDKQDCVKFRTEYLQTALQVSAEGDSAVVLLNPEVVTNEGEWETWFFANWLPGACRYRSFAEWLADERRTCAKQLKPLPKAKVQKYLMARKPVSVSKAQQAARSGQTEVALESLEAFAAQGEESAAPSLAELYAFLGRWNDAISNAGRLLANPGAAHAGNVLLDMINLLGRAGHRSGEWGRVIEVVETAAEANLKRDFGKYGNPVRDSRNKQLRNLIEYARRGGAPPHELLAIFGVHDPMAAMSQSEREGWYQNAVANVDKLRPDLKKNPKEKAEYFFSLAKGALEEEALRLYEAHGGEFLMKWQAAEYVAPIYIRRGKPEAAWAVIADNLRHWWPVDQAQVTPIVLLTDQYLDQLMTPERCQIVLSTPRGPEGAKKAR
jgi:hypothetical protein